MSLSSPSPVVTKNSFPAVPILITEHTKTVADACL